MLQGKRACRKCKSVIPNRIKIDGKIRSLQRRVFCTDCSPFGSHNTVPDDPNRPRALSTDKMREDARVAWRKSADKALQKARETKEELIRLSGGGCARCGYSKYSGALEFHHIDPSSKIFGLSVGNLRAKKLDVIISEWSKCVLLCSNCHREIEHESRIPSVKAAHNE